MLSATKSYDVESLLDHAIELQNSYEVSTPLAERKERGQYFTPPEVCRFMADLFTIQPQNPLRLLDPGAGIGSLTAAVCDRLMGIRTSRDIEIHVFENDPALLPLLRQSMNRCCCALHSVGHDARYVIHEEDFILDAAATVFGERSLFSNRSYGQFDAVIMNPPYFKVAKDSAHAIVMRDVVHGQPNIYAFFMAAGAEMLRAGGELVAITPRSFCNGLYFRGFRHWFSERVRLERIHLFESRTDTFRDVLQESIVTHWRRQAKQSDSIAVSTSFGRDVLGSIQVRSVPASMVIDNSAGDFVIRVPGSVSASAVVAAVESWPQRFSELGLKASTGPVVTFRATEFLLPVPNGEEWVPLLSVFNVKPFETLWPVAHKKHATAFKVCPDSLSLLLRSQNYVLLRRFSAKEERRRLTASCLIGRDVPYPWVAIENHLNYVYHALRELTIDETYGLAALFNSALLDQYFRTLSGNTQVNATELRTMPLPDLEMVSRIGRAVQKLSVRTSSAVEETVLAELGIRGDLRTHLMEVACG
jgi:adenine-specific DNA-methyltransferase